MKISTTLAVRAMLALGLLVSAACEDAKKDAQADAEGKAGAMQAEPAKAEAPTMDVAQGDAAKGDAAQADAAKADDPLPTIGPTIGVAECDQYIAQMTACFASDAIPVEERDRQKLGFDASVKRWAEAVATNPEGSTALANGCKAATDMARIAYPKCFDGGQ